MKKIRLIIEGSERSGKSSLQRNLTSWCADNDFWPVTTIHATNFKMKDKSKIKEYSEKYYSNIFESFNNSNCSFIMDRCHLSESVFSPMYRNYDGDYVFELEKEHEIDLSDNTFLIYLYDTPESIMSREDGDSLSTTVKSIQQEIDLFKKAFEKSNIKNKLMVFIQDFDLDTTKVFEHVSEWIKGRL